MTQSGLYTLSLAALAFLGISIFRFLYPEMIRLRDANKIGQQAVDARRFWPLLLVSMVLVSVYRSFVSFVIFFSFVMALRPISRLTPVVLIIVLSVFAEGTSGYIGRITFTFAPEVMISDIAQSISHLGDRLIFSSVSLAVSMVYLGGTSTILGFGPEYVLAGVVLSYFLFKRNKDRNMRLFLAASVVTSLTVILSVPTLQVFRYHVYIVPVFVHILICQGRGTIAFAGNCVVMRVAYFLQAGSLDG